MPTLLEIIAWLIFSGLVALLAGRFIRTGMHDEDENGDINRDL